MAQLTSIRRAFGVIATVLLLAACQAAPVAPSAAPEPPVDLDIQRYVSVPAAEGALVAADANDVLAVRSAAEPVEIPLTYPRGVEERWVWAGTEQGDATLLNQYGQVVHHMSPDSAPVTATVPAGRYTLRLAGMPRGLTVITETDGPASLTRRFATPSDDVSRGFWRDEFCGDARAHMKTAKEMAGLIHKYPLKWLSGLFIGRSESHYFQMARSQVIVDYNRYVDFAKGHISEGWCPDMEAYWYTNRWRELRRTYIEDEHTIYQYEKWYKLLP